MCRPFPTSILRWEIVLRSLEIFCNVAQQSAIYPNTLINFIIYAQTLFQLLSDPLLFGSSWFLDVDSKLRGFKGLLRFCKVVCLSCRVFLASRGALSLFGNAFFQDVAFRHPPPRPCYSSQTRGPHTPSSITINPKPYMAEPAVYLSEGPFTWGGL